MFLDWDEVLLALQLVLMLALQLPKVPPLQAPSEVEPRKLVPHSSRHPLLLPFGAAPKGYVPGAGRGAGSMGADSRGEGTGPTGYNAGVGG